MVLQFKVVPAERCSKKDVITGLGIYCKSVDSGSLTDTNQIKDYIWNKKDHINEKRTMFFFLMYGQDDNVIGFSEFAYLPQNQVLILDYLCTVQRNHLLFYNFYHMVLQEISDTLKKRGQFVRYVITELSLTQIDGKLIDTDSNYFRHLLSNENFRLLKYPYYQPPLLHYEDAEEFNLAIKNVSSDETIFTLRKSQYIAIVEEIYFSHYLEWYCNYRSNYEFNDLLKELFIRIQKEILKDEFTESISLVQCQLFEEGQCPKISVENVTIPREKKKKRTRLIISIIGTFLSFITFIFCANPMFYDITAIITSFLTIIAGIISIITFRKDF